MCQMTFEEITKTEAKKVAETEEDVEQEAIAENITGSFACCNYYDECSEKKECLFKNDELHTGCMYRKNLERGNIFYGKNAVNFSHERYEQIYNYYKSLPDNDKVIFNDLMAYFNITRRTTQSCLCIYNEKMHDFLNNSPCFSIFPAEGLAAFLFDVDILQVRSAEKFHKEHSDIAPPNLDYIAKNEEINDGTKTQLKHNAWKKFYVEKDHKLCHELATRFLYIGINKEYSLELDELFHDELKEFTPRYHYKCLEYFKIIKINPKDSDEEKKKKTKEKSDILKKFRKELN